METENGGFIVVHAVGGGKHDHGNHVHGGWWGSWNVSRTDGPLGPPCLLPRPEDNPIECYDSCGGMPFVILLRMLAQLFS